MKFDWIDLLGALRYPDRFMWIVPVSSTSLVQPGGIEKCRLGQLDHGRTVELGARGRDPAQHLELDLLAIECGLAAGVVEIRRVIVARELDLDPGRGGGHPDRDELELLIGVAVAVTLLVLGLERVAQLVRVGRRRAGDRELERLAAVTELVDDVQVGLGLVHRLAGALAELRHVLLDPLRGESVAAEEHASLDVAPARRDDEAERRENPGGTRAQDRVNPELVGDLRGVQPSGATERHQRVPPRVDAALHGDDPERADHLGAGDAADPLGARLDVVEAELVGEVADRFASRLAVELDVAPQWRVRGQVTEHEVRVGDRRLGAAPPVARGTGIGARRPGADPERPAGVPPCDRAAARSDGVDRQHRQSQRTARDLAA